MFGLDMDAQYTLGSISALMNPESYVANTGDVDNMDLVPVIRDGKLVYELVNPDTPGLNIFMQDNIMISFGGTKPTDTRGLLQTASDAGFLSGAYREQDGRSLDSPGEILMALHQGNRPESVMGMPVVGTGILVDGDTVAGALLQGLKTVSDYYAQGGVEPATTLLDALMLGRQAIKRFVVGAGVGTKLPEAFEKYQQWASLTDDVAKGVVTGMIAQNLSDDLQLSDKAGFDVVYDGAGFGSAGANVMSLAALTLAGGGPSSWVSRLASFGATFDGLALGSAMYQGDVGKILSASIGVGLDYAGAGLSHAYVDSLNGKVAANSIGQMYTPRGVTIAGKAYLAGQYIPMKTLQAQAGTFSGTIPTSLSLGWFSASMAGGASGAYGYPAGSSYGMPSFGQYYSPSRNGMNITIDTPNPFKWKIGTF